MTYCEKCMRPMEGKSVCPVCGVLPEAPYHHLAPGSVLQEKYQIGRAIAEDGGSITYLARDISTDEVVAIREFFPAEEVRRDSRTDNAVEGMEKYEKAAARFLEKARLLSEFRNEPCVAGVTDYFRAGHTSYMVTTPPDGLSLQTYVQKKGPVQLDTLLELMLPLLQTLRQIHRKNLIHRNICPENLRLYADGSVKLVGFGSVSGAVDENTLKPGFAPAELYGLRGRSGPWTDVYAMCASIYYCITGVVPTLSAERAALDLLPRPSELGAVLTSRQEAAIMHGLSVWPEARQQSLLQLMEELDLTVQEELPVPEEAEELPAFPVEEAAQISEEEPAVPEQAPRFEPVEDPADWMDMPKAPKFLDLIFRQGKAYAEPELTVQEHKETDLWTEELEGEPEEDLLDDLIQEPMEEPAEEVSAEEIFAEETPEEETPAEVTPAEDVPAEDAAQTSLWEQLLAQPDEEPAWEDTVEQTSEETPTEEEVPAEEAPAEETPAEEAAQPEEDWQGDYTPVEPIDPKFWQKELGLTEPDEPMPWEEAPGAWEETPKPWDVPEQWPEEPAEETQEKKRKLWPIFVAAGVLIVAALAAIFWMLFGGKGPDPVLTLDGIAYTLPCTLAELNEDGWLAQDLEETVGVDHVVYPKLEKNGTIRVLAYNPADADAPVGACVVTKIAVTDSAVDVDVSGIDLTASLEDVVAALGKPHEQTDTAVTYQNSTGCTWTFTKADEGDGLKSIVMELPE